MPWRTEPDEYRRLSAYSEDPALAYRKQCRQPLAAQDLEAIRSHLNKDCALGSSRFQGEIEAMAGLEVRVVPRGRPKKTKDGTEK